MYDKKTVVIFVISVSLTVSGIFAQEYAGMYGFQKNSANKQFYLQGLEDFNSVQSSVHDWELSAVYGKSFGSESASNLNSISLAKKVGNHFFYGRYSPGLKSIFQYKTGIEFVSENNVNIQPVKTIDYSELLGFGYSYSFNSAFAAGFKMRYYKQQFSKQLTTQIFTDTSSYFTTIDTSEQKNFWTADLGLSLMPFENLSLFAQSDNLFKIDQESNITGENANLELRKEIGFLFGINYSPAEKLNFKSVYHTKNSFLIGINYFFPLFSGNITAGISAFHSRFREPYIAGIVPVISFSTDLFTVSAGGIKYFGSNTRTNTLQRFEEKGIDNVYNNYYSDNKIFASVSLALSFKNEQRVKFISLEMTGSVFPVYSEYYVENPFAKARVENLTNDPVTVIPASFCHDLNEERIESPAVTIAPKDTADVFFYTIPDDAKKFLRTGISEVDFELEVADNPDDKIQKPLLIQDRNGWDGKVINLKYFVRSELNKSGEYSKKILNRYKPRLDTVAGELKQFYKIKILYDEFVKGLQYVADPRASAERVQYPSETLELKGGDCDDLAVCFSSMLEGIGLQTAFIDYKSGEGIKHVNLLVNTQISPDFAKYITGNDKKIFVRKNRSGEKEIWLPVETTVLTNFDEAWQEGAKRFYNEALRELGLMKNKVEIIDLY